MRVEDLRAGTLVSDARVTGKKRGFVNGRPTVAVTFTPLAPGGEPYVVTYNVGQNVPGSPRATSAAFMPATVARLNAEQRNQRSRRTFLPDADETAAERLARRAAVLLAAAA